MFIGLMHGLSVELLNPLSNLSMKVFDFLGSFLDLPTKLARSGDKCEVQGSLQIAPIDQLKWGKVGGFTWSSVESKLRIG